MGTPIHKRFDKKILKDKIYDLTNQSFGVVYSYRKVQWWSCRDLLHDHKKISRLVYCTDEPDKVIKFIDKAQDILKLEPEHRAKLEVSNLPCVLFVDLGPFWKHRMRRSLLTILMRAAAEYKKAFWKACLEHPYLNESEYALRRFMKGYTTINVNFKNSGWFEAFSKYEVKYRGVKDINKKIDSQLLKG